MSQLAVLILKISNIILNLILELSKKNKSTSIIATHNLDLIKKLDICYKIERGRLVEYSFIKNYSSEKLHPVFSIQGRNKD